MLSVFANGYLKITKSTMYGDHQITAFENKKGFVINEAQNIMIVLLSSIVYLYVRKKFWGYYIKKVTMSALAFLASADFFMPFLMKWVHFPQFSKLCNGGTTPLKSIFIGEMNKRWKKKRRLGAGKRVQLLFATNQMRFCTV